MAIFFYTLKQTLLRIEKRRDFLQVQQRIVAIFFGLADGAFVDGGSGAAELVLVEGGDGGGAPRRRGGSRRN